MTYTIKYIYIYTRVYHDYIMVDLLDMKLFLVLASQSLRITIQVSDKIKID